MPLVSVTSSLPESSSPTDFLKVLSREISSLLGKPEAYVMTKYVSNVEMTFAGNTDPCCYVELKNIGSLNTSVISNSLCEIITANLGIPPSRTYIYFEDVDPRNWGFNSRTFG